MRTLISRSQNAVCSVGPRSTPLMILVLNIFTILGWDRQGLKLWQGSARLFHLKDRHAWTADSPRGCSLLCGAVCVAADAQGRAQDGRRAAARDVRGCFRRGLAAAEATACETAQHTRAPQLNFLSRLWEHPAFRSFLYLFKFSFCL